MKVNDPIQSRFIRQIQLKSVGLAGQEKLSKASVLVIGAGGLGCPALQYLAGAGIGKIGIMDFDRVEESNLHRQLLFTIEDIGRFKAEVSAERIQAIAPDSEIDYINEELTNELALRYFNKYDLVVDATDQIHVRYLINDFCGINNIPWVYGAVNGFEGQWALFGSNTFGNYRDLFPIPANPLKVVNCENNGILGPVPGIVGTHQALLVLKYILGIHAESTMLHTMNYLENTLYNIEITKGNNTGPKSVEEFMTIDYRKMLVDAHYS